MHFEKIREALAAFQRDHASRFGAALAFNIVLTIAPIAVIAIGVAAMFGRRMAEREIFRQLADILGPATASAIGEIVKHAAVQRVGFTAISFALVTLLLGLMGIYEQIEDALNTIWKVEHAPTRGIAATIVARVRAIALVFGVGCLLFVIVSADAAVAIIGKYAANHLTGGEPLWQAVQLTVSVVVLSALFAIMFRYIPVIKVPWRDVRPGAAFTAFLFVIGKFALGLYLGKAAVGSSYGAAGSLVVILVWAYWSAQIFFFGLELTHVYAEANPEIHMPSGSDERL